MTLRDLPESMHSLVLSYIDKYPYRLRTIHEDLLDTPVLKAFEWAKTPEGSDYWDNVNKGTIILTSKDLNYDVY